MDLSGYTLTFSDEFDTRSISATGDETIWASIRDEWRLDDYSDLGFGASSFLDASSGYDPFEVSEGVLTISAVPDQTPYGAPGNWESGLITTQGSFSQTYGYFEMRADLSDHPRSWGAFWLLPDAQAPNPENRTGWQEIDIIEHYGNHNIGTYSWIHTTDPHSDPAAELQVYGEFTSQQSGFHNYGVEWTPETITFYYDGVEIGSKPTPSDMHGPMYVLADLAVQPGDGGYDQAMDMKIDYIRVYAPNTSLPDTQEPSEPASGPDELVVRVRQDAYLGDAQFIVRIDGQQIGGINSADEGAVTLTGSFGERPGEVSIEFINDLYHGTTVTDRNLYVEEIVYNGKTYAGDKGAIDGGGLVDGAAFLHSTGSKATFSLTEAVPQTPVPSEADEIILRVSQDAYLGNAEFIVKVDGLQAGGVQTAESSQVSIRGDFGSPGAITVEFINDLYHGTESTDRNLYVEQLIYNGDAYSGATGTIANGSVKSDLAFLHSSGSSVTFDLGSEDTVPVTSSNMSMRVSQDAYLGDAEFIVKIDGQQIGSVYSASEGVFDFSIDSAVAPGEISIEFVNDLYHGAESTDRNLYVESMTYDGQYYEGSAGQIAGGWSIADSAFLYGTGSSVTFNVANEDRGWTLGA